MRLTIAAARTSRFARGRSVIVRLPAIVAAFAALAAWSSEAPARTIRVGASGDVREVSAAAKLAADGDIVEVAAGEYRGDVAVWVQRQLTIRAVGGRARLVADGRSAEDKGIWVIRDGEFVVEGFDFVGARVADGNGAGIRFERGRLTVRDTRFLDNEMGLLAGNDAASVLVVDRCEFSGPAEGAGIHHNLYAGLIDRLVVTASWLHDARVGHLLKSRARESVVEYNRLTDQDGSASYELEFPNGGEARVIGNIVEQSPRSPNRTIISFGAEGYRWRRNMLALSHNTIVNRQSGTAVFVYAAPGSASFVLVDNLWVGAGVFELPAATRRAGDRIVPPSALRDVAAYDFRPLTARVRPDLASPLFEDLVPTREYVHERSTKALRMPARYPGALQP